MYLIFQPFTPPWEFTHLKTAFAAAETGAYVAAIPDNGTVAPIVIEFAVTPGVDPAAPALLESNPVVMPPRASADTLSNVIERRRRFIVDSPCEMLVIAW